MRTPELQILNPLTKRTRRGRFRSVLWQVNLDKNKTELSLLRNISQSQTIEGSHMYQSHNDLNAVKQKQFIVLILQSKSDTANFSSLI